MKLESELLEEPLVLARLVPLLKLDLGLSPGFAFESRIPEDILVDNSFVQRNIHRVSGGHEVVVVEHLDESLDLGPLGNLLLAHGCGHFTGIAVNACDQSVAVRTVGCAIVNVLDDDGFAPGVASS